MRFIRRHGRVIPIRDENVVNAHKHYNEALKSAAKNGAISGVIQHVARVGMALKMPRFTRAMSYLAIGNNLVGDLRRTTRAINIKKESGGKIGFIHSYVGQTATANVSNMVVQKLGYKALGPQVKAAMKAKGFAGAGMRKAHAFSERVADNRRFRKAKLVRPPISGLLTKGQK